MALITSCSSVSLFATLAIPIALGAQQQLPQRRPVTPNASIRITGSFGSLRIIGWDRDSIAVSGAIPAGARFDGNIADKGPPAAGVKMYLETTDSVAASAKLEIYVPAGARVWTKGNVSNVEASGVTGGLDINVVGGSVRVTGVPHELTVEAMDANVTVTGAPEWLRVKTATGDIAISGGSNDAGLSTISGAIRVAGGPFERGRFETVTGPILFAGEAVRTASLDFTTHSGTVELRLPPKFQGELDAATMTGTIENTLTGRPAVATRDGRGQEIGIMTGPGPRFYVRSFKGVIALRPFLYKMKAPMD